MNNIINILYRDPQDKIDFEELKSYTEDIDATGISFFYLIMIFDKFLDLWPAEEVLGYYITNNIDKFL